MEYTVDEKELIKKLYIKDGLNTVSISKIISRSQSGVERFLKRENLYAGIRGLEVSECDLKSIIARYLLGETSEEIYKDYSDKLTSPDTILSLLKKHNVKRRPAKRRSVITNHSYFKIIDTEAKAYFLGLLIADGSVVNNAGNRAPSIRLELKSEDSYIIEKFAKEIGFQSQIGLSRGCNYISFTSIEMAKDLSNYGVVPNKTYVGTFLPLITEDLIRHLIRGIFDGDGTVYICKNNSFNWGFYGSDLLCNQIQDYLSIKLNFKKNKVFNKGSVSFIYLHSESRTRKFYDYIYKKSEIYLLRKKNKFDSYLVNTEISKSNKKLLPFVEHRD